MKDNVIEARFRPAEDNFPSIRERTDAIIREVEEVKERTRRRREESIMLTGKLSTKLTTKAIHYSIKWLEQEIGQIENSLVTCSDPIAKRLLDQRLAELKDDYEKFQALNE